MRIYNIQKVKVAPKRILMKGEIVDYTSRNKFGSESFFVGS